jgi:23S rRNA (uridine2552-2'-O)-methyltransferase
MPDKNWRKQQGKDQYFKKAKVDGYRARSAYKLEEINQRQRVIRLGDRVLDIGAAPGSWSQLAVELVGNKGKVVAVDITAIQPMQGVSIVQGDVRDPAIKAQLRDLAGEHPYNAVISDIAPNTTGIGPTDHARSIELSLHALVIGIEMLGKGGNFITKVFTGEDFDKLLALTRRYFRRVSHISPDATRKESKETFIVANNLFARAPLDPDMGLEALLEVEAIPIQIEVE